jgi:hypothetical protein
MWREKAKKGIRKLSVYRELQRAHYLGWQPTHHIIGLCAWYIQINAPPNILPPCCAEMQMKRNTFSCFLYGGGEVRGVGLAPRGFSHVQGRGCKFSQLHDLQGHVIWGPLQSWFNQVLSLGFRLSPMCEVACGTPGNTGDWKMVKWKNHCTWHCVSVYVHNTPLSDLCLTICAFY